METSIGYIEGIGTYELETPEEAIFIYSRHVYCRVRITDNSNNPIAGTNILFSITDDIGEVLYNESRYTDNNGQVVMDIARILQTITNNREEEMASLMYDADENAMWAMRRVKMQFTVNSNEMFHMLNTPFAYYTLINGAHDNAYDWRNTPRYENAIRLKWWAEYPFTLDFINTDLINVSQNGLGEIREIAKLPADSEYQMIRLNPAGLGITANRALILPRNRIGFTIIDGVLYDNKRNIVMLDIDRCPKSDRKTYLRWLGSHGEVFYWLFDNITEDISVKSELYSRAMTDNEFRGLVTNRMRDNGIIRDIETTRTRTISTELLDSDYYDIVQSVAASPFVDMLIGEGEGEKWQRVNVTDASFSRSLKTANRAKRHRIVLTIEISEL